MEELKKKLEEMATAFEEFKKANDARLTEIKSKGYASKETEEKVDKINAAITGLEVKTEEMKVAINRTAAAVPEKDQTKEDEKKWNEYRGACLKFMRKNTPIPTELMDWAKKTMSVDSDEDGGFFVTPETTTRIIEKVFESSPMRQLSTVITIGSDSYELLHDLDEVGSGWVGETQARPATATSKIKKEVVPVHELYAYPHATQKTLDDAGINLESWLQNKVVSKFARDEATAFVSGNGVAKPKGVLDYGSGDGFGLIERKTTASNSAYTGDELIDTQSLLKEPYQANATWAINRLQIGYIRKLKDTTGQYLWQPGLGQGVPPLLLGRPVSMFSDLSASIVAATDMIMYGDFRAGYLVVDRIGIRVLRDAYTNKPYVGFYTTKRVGGAVQNFEAIKVMKMAA